jgi:uncharacterized membrane protein
MLAWLRRTFLTGFFVTVPLVVSVVAFIWVFRFADGVTAGLDQQLFGMRIPGLGIMVTMVFVLAAGATATNVFGRRVLQRSEELLLHVPLFKTVYAPVKQLISAFAPDNEVGFKRMVLIEDQARGYVLGFLTKEFTVDRGAGPETMLAVYVPTNHLYLGDIVVCPVSRATFPDLSVEEGLRVFLTGGTGLPDRLRVKAGPRG